MTGTEAHIRPQAIVPIAAFRICCQADWMSKTLPDPTAAQIRTSFNKQGLMRAIGASLVEVEAGSVIVELVPSSVNSQQHGYVHAGAVSAIADTAAGYAAQTLMPAGRAVLTTEFKINLLAPAIGDRLTALGKVVKLVAR